MKTTIENILREYPLPEGWEITEKHMSELLIGDLTLNLVGLAANAPQGWMVTGSAVECGESPLLRAYFELLERVCILLAESERQMRYPLMDLNGKIVGEVGAEMVFPQSPEPELWRYAKSNGVAAHVEKEKAFRNSVQELFERDRVLRSWYGETIPEKVSMATLPVHKALTDHFIFEAYRFSERLGSPFQVAGVFAFPKSSDRLRAYGFSARSTIDQAIQDSLRECYQAIGFLYSEKASDEEPTFSPSPDYHQEVYLRKDGIDRIRNWLAGGHAGIRHSKRENSAVFEASFVDLSPAYLKGKVWVIKSIDSRRFPLVFGRWGEMEREVPSELLIHPVA